jgi:predicted Zn-dependent peptidase
LRDSGIGEDMISSAQNYILGQFPTRLETSFQLAAQLAVLEAYGFDSTYIDDYGAAILEADSETVTAVIGDVYPSSQDLVFVLLGDASLIRDSVDKYGPITEMKIAEPRFRPAAPD